MNHRKTYEELDIVLNSEGEVDVEFYYQKARAMQAAALKELLSSAGKGISNRLQALYHKYVCLNCSSAH